MGRGRDLVVVGAVRAEVQVHREFLGVERRPEGVGTVRLPVRAGVGADVPVLRRALAKMLAVLAEVGIDVAVTGSVFHLAVLDDDDIFQALVDAFAAPACAWNLSDACGFFCISVSVSSASGMAEMVDILLQMLST